MADKIKVGETEFNTDELIKKATELQTGPDIYANFAQIVITNNEMVIDFYTLSPTPGNSNKPRMQHNQRVMLPLQLVPGFNAALQTTWENFQSQDNPVVKIIHTNERKE